MLWKAVTALGFFALVSETDMRTSERRFVRERFGFDEPAQDGPLQ